jgi:hypothetical protein
MYSPQMGIPSITTNLSGFGCFMADLIERPQDEGCYIVDRRSQSVEDAVQQLSDYMHAFSTKTRRQRINQVGTRAFIEQTLTRTHAAQPRRAPLAAARLEEPGHRVQQVAPAGAAARVPRRVPGRRGGRRGGRGRGVLWRGGAAGVGRAKRACEPAVQGHRDAGGYGDVDGGGACARVYFT